MKFFILALFVTLACVSAVPAGETDANGAKCEISEGLQTAAKDFIAAINGERPSFDFILRLILTI